MQFIDYVKINIRSGKGGNGCSSFRREKYVPRGGPNGGDGGHGGDVMFKGNAGKNTLLDLRYRQHYRAQDGKAGKGKDQHGRNGETLVIEVPLGTLVRDVETGQVMVEVLAAGLSGANWSLDGIAGRAGREGQRPLQDLHQPGSRTM